MNFENGVVTFRHEYLIIDEWNETTFYDGYKYVHPAPAPIEGRIIVGRANGKSMTLTCFLIHKVTSELIRRCPNKRVVHLACSAKTHRARKKNFKRMIKIVRKIGEEK